VYYYVFATHPVSHDGIVVLTFPSVCSCVWCPVRLCVCMLACGTRLRLACRQLTSRFFSNFYLPRKVTISDNFYSVDERMKQLWSRWMACEWNRCPRCKGEDSRVPAMCLVCGEVVCSQSYCCQTEVDSVMVGAATAHASVCGAGTGIFLRYPLLSSYTTAIMAWFSWSLTVLTVVDVKYH